LGLIYSYFCRWSQPKGSKTVVVSFRCIFDIMYDIFLLLHEDGWITSSCLGRTNQPTERVVGTFREECSAKRVGINTVTSGPPAPTRRSPNCIGRKYVQSSQIALVENMSQSLIVPLNILFYHQMRIPRLWLNLEPYKAVSAWSFVALYVVDDVISKNACHVSHSKQPTPPYSQSFIADPPHHTPQHHHSQAISASSIKKNVTKNTRKP